MGGGLPIGNLTSQHFANCYLAPLDRFIKESLRCRAYVRYMDDFVIWGRSREELKACLRAVTEFLGERLGLAVKPEPMLNRVSCGMDFLGYRLFGDTVRLSRRSRQRFQTKLGRYESQHKSGQMSEGDLQRRVIAQASWPASRAPAGAADKSGRPSSNPCRMESRRYGKHLQRPPPHVVGYGARMASHIWSAPGGRGGYC